MKKLKKENKNKQNKTKQNKTKQTVSKLHQPKKMYQITHTHLNKDMFDAIILNLSEIQFQIDEKISAIGYNSIQDHYWIKFGTKLFVEMRYCENGIEINPIISIGEKMVERFIRDVQDTIELLH